jgi:transposase, IS30 family
LIASSVRPFLRAGLYVFLEELQGVRSIGTLVERTTRFTMLLHLPRLDGHDAAPRAKNGPALAGHGAEAVRNFCDPQSPWQRGANENTNELLRQYFPKGTDLSAHSAETLAAVAATLNARPRKTLGWKTPAEALDHWLA